MPLTHPIANSDRQRFDQCARWAETGNLPQAAGQFVADAGGRETARLFDPFGAMRRVAHVAAGRIAGAEEPGLVVEPSRVAQAPGSPEPDPKAPGLSRNQFRRGAFPVSIPGEAQEGAASAQALLGHEVEPDAAIVAGRNGSDPPDHRVLPAIEGGGQTVRERGVPIDQRPQEPTDEHGGGNEAPHREQEERERSECRRVQPRQGLETVHGENAEQERNRRRAHLAVPPWLPSPPGDQSMPAVPTLASARFSVALAQGASLVARFDDCRRNVCAR